MKTADEAISELQRQLDDTDGELWTRDRLLDFLQEGYDGLCRESECLFDLVMYDTQPRAGNYTKDFEKDFMTGPILGKFNATKESDTEFMEGGAELSNFTKPSDSEYMTEEGHDPTYTGLRRLPESMVSVDRVTHNWLRLKPQHDRYNRLTRTQYQTLQGGVFQYQMDQDGWKNLRLVNVPAFVSQTEDISGLYGPIRQVTSYDLDTEVVIGSYGAIRSTPKHFACGSLYGVVRRIVPDENNTRVELFRVGGDLASEPFEIPDRMVKYVQWWALYRVYSTPGESENPKLAAHFRQRFDAGIERLKSRVRSAMRERTLAMGSKRSNIRDNYLEHFPADYGYSRPFRQ